MNDFAYHAISPVNVSDEVSSTLVPPAEQLELSPNQTTISRSVDCDGVALHSGRMVSLSLKPAGPNTGIVFRRSDLPMETEIEARWENVVDTRMCTTLGNEEGVIVSTVEHLMAALSGCHVDNAIIEVSGSEVPVMDGSAQPFVFLIERAGVEEFDVPRRIIEILKPVKVESEDRLAELLPSNSFSVGFQIEFQDTAVSRQQILITLVNGTFKNEIARARTFGFVHEIEALRASGLALGGSLENAVVVDGDKVLNDGGLRYDDEFVRHKVLDAVGDLYLAGAPIRGHYQGFRAGHQITNKLLQTLFADPTAWRIVELTGQEVALGRGYTPISTEDSVPLVATA